MLYRYDVLITSRDSLTLYMFHLATYLKNFTADRALNTSC